MRINYVTTYKQAPLYCEQVRTLEVCNLTVQIEKSGANYATLPTEDPIVTRPISASSDYPVLLGISVHTYGQTLAAAAVSAKPRANYDDLEFCMYLTQ